MHCRWYLACAWIQHVSEGDPTVIESVQDLELSVNDVARGLVFALRTPLDHAQDDPTVP
ncbi:hypothetical protein [Streptomyces sp. NPDC087294]|uniref:hypothetical protein n=1 Tax=Streptomyces sp. NPDC087294 TaxID=3365777 RepID=UPI00381C54F8